jgi:hypothetical protein
MRNASRKFLSAVLVGALAVPSALGQAAGSFLHDYPTTTRIADPKLEHGGVRVDYRLDAGPASYIVTIEAWQNGHKVSDVWRGMEKGQLLPLSHFWGGVDANGNYVDPGRYQIRVEAMLATGGRTERVHYPVDVVRLGLINIAAESSSGTNEWQTVYYLKNGLIRFYATPSTSEWVSKAFGSEISDLDNDDGTPRAAPTTWPGVAEPKIYQTGTGTWKYDTTSHDYPLCYLAGAQPQLTVTFGATCTDQSGAQIGVNYPVAGFDLRCIANDEAGGWTSSNNVNVAPGAQATFLGPALTTDATRNDRHVRWRWQYRATGTTSWIAIPGAFTTEHQIHTIIGAPFWPAGATGTQYAGPWVEVLDYMHTWQEQFGIVPSDDAHVVELLIKGYNGQPTLDHAIENVCYDCPGNGGDGGATHYFDFGTGTMDLTSLLNGHTNGIFVNCSDTAAGTSSMLEMLGIQNVQMEMLGSMTLRAIWGIGSDDYTLDLWGNGGGGGHGFSYHHIITRDAGVNISDACLWVDDDGHPNRLPGTPGFNNDRDWNNYESLLAKANVTWQLDVTPKLK